MPFRIFRRIDAKLDRLIEEVRKMSSETDGLKQAVVDLTSAVSDNSTAVSAEIDSLKAKLAGIGTSTPLTDDDRASIKASTDAIEALVGNIRTATDAAKAAVAPTPAPDAPAAS